MIYKRLLKRVNRAGFLLLLAVGGGALFRLPLAHATVAAYGGFKEPTGKARVGKTDLAQEEASGADSGPSDDEDLFKSPFASLSSKLPPLGTPSSGTHSSTTTKSAGTKASPKSPTSSALTSSGAFDDKDDPESSQNPDDDF